MIEARQTVARVIRYARHTRMNLIEAVKRLMRQERFGDAIALINDFLQQNHEQELDALIVGSLVVLRCECLAHQQDFRGSLADLARAESIALQEPPLRILVNSARGTVLMLQDPHDPDLPHLFEENARFAKVQGDMGAEADALFNLATCYSIVGEPIRAVVLWQEAKTLYEKRGLHQQVNDCRHMIGAAHRAVENDQLSVGALEEALKAAVEASDQPAVARIAGDLARTHYCREDVPKEERDAVARQLCGQVELAEDLLWRAARSSPRSVGARIQRARESALNLETSLLLAADANDIVSLLRCSLRAKARILREDLSSRDTRKLRDIDTVAEVPSEDSVHALARLSRELSAAHGGPVALVDMLALSGSSMLTSVLVASEDPSWTVLRRMWGGSQQRDPTLAGMYGEKQCVDATAALARITEAMESIAGKSSMLFTDDQVRDAGSREFLGEEASKARADLVALGEWAFPAGLRGFFRDEGVRHVYLSPDHRFFDMPWLALEFGDGGALIEEPWSLSITPSLSLLHDVRRRRGRRAGHGLSIFAPSNEVNASLGGNDEVARIKGIFPDARVLMVEQATLSEWSASFSTSSWIHLRSHGDESASATHAPLLANGLIVDEADGQNAFPFVTSVACRTGSTAPRGTDVFGFAECIERSDGSGLVAPVVSVEGVLASYFVGSFYQHVSEHGAAKALQLAAREYRARFVHPALWGAFVCIGDPLSRPR